MKFAITAVAFLAFILGAQSSYIPSNILGLGLNGLGLGVNPLGLTQVGLGLNGLGLGIGGINTLGLNTLLSPLGLGHRADLSGVAVGIPGQSLSQGPAILAAPAAAISLGHRGIIAPGATYVAKTRGAIHTAPLDGHINSAASINVAPAPGTL
ncbi:adult cuticle protein 1-like [Episyrphus balteatus]|uniref:adult cuticle protein 1-like n=1 Tax=Episyrphus balteatus TaxID=286459 RepID=UPI002486A726|nr:adult cuticle protein 1-like [Episyrphus balteatus]